MSDAGADPETGEIADHSAPRQPAPAKTYAEFSEAIRDAADKAAADAVLAEAKPIMAPEFYDELVAHHQRTWDWA